MSSEEFEKLQEVYRSLYEELKLLSERVTRAQGEEKKKLVRGFDERHGEAQELLKDMEQELISAPSAFRNSMSSKVRLYHRDLGKLQRHVHASDIGFGFSSGTGDSVHGSAYADQNERSTEQQAQRALLIQGTESLNNASQSIARSQRIAIESEHIGTDIIEELGQQREQLDRTRDRLVHTGENLSRSRKILRTMSRRLMTNKLLLGIIIIMELAILGAVVYLKFFRH
ncbi:vesicle transport through interaction with t-SNAREs homolog 1B [Clarias gariepinus]|uniref:vesicle transport through interaction with t-SNAREs homolog 1B n=1 Tax=Clarias gariepinus TaxID=13013 RepID=UPI00234D88C8|nr:vesicle transport through interaction with t-SNAREs homolog 1B [Clarias gariepinus]